MSKKQKYKNGVIENKIWYNVLMLILSYGGNVH